MYHVWEGDWQDKDDPELVAAGAPCVRRCAASAWVESRRLTSAMAHTWIQRLAKKTSFRTLTKSMSMYPPYLGAGIRVAEVSDDGRVVTIELAKRSTLR